MFSWDAAKALKNYEKHGVSFEEASTVFGDPHALGWEDLEHPDLNERRWKHLAFSTANRLLLIVYTLRRSENDKETIRIISARRASHKEREGYSG
jgi:uncharacterized protein